jgi:AAA family ATP:ADP antiporter
VKALKAFLNVRRGELPFVLLMFFYFFLVIAVFWILKPLKTNYFFTFYGKEGTFDLLGWTLQAPQAEQLAKVCNMVVAFGAMATFSALSRRLHRQQLTYVFAAFSGLAALSFAPLLRSPGELDVWAFYLFGDLFNTLMLTSFFAFLNDSVAPEDTKRLYGPIVLGGVAGGAVGSLGLRVLIDEVAPMVWFFVVAGLVMVIAILAQQAGQRILHAPLPATASAEHQKAGQGSAALEGARLVFRSRYFLAIVAIVGLYEIISSVLDYQFKATLHHYLEGAAFGRHLATVYLITNVTGLAVQLFLTSAIMSRLGIRVALLVMPLVIMGNSLAFVALPLLWIGSLLSVTDNSLNYSLNQSARESLYTPASRDEKYKAKAFIDMFIQRFGKALAVGVNLAMAAAFGTFGSVRWLSVAVVILVAVWLVAASYAGRRFREITGSETAEPG